MAHVLDTEKDVQIQFGQVLKRQKIHVSIIFYHFLSTVPLDLKYFQNLDQTVKSTFKIRSSQIASLLKLMAFGPSIILRSILPHLRYILLRWTNCKGGSFDIEYVAYTKIVGVSL